MKICSTCKIEKELNKFALNKRGKYGVHSRCKICTKEYTRKNYVNNIEKRKEDREFRKDKMKQYYIENKERLKEYYKQYKEQNKDYYKEYYKNYVYNRRKKDSLFKFKSNTRSLIRTTFKRCVNPLTKNKNTESILGCTIEDFRLYIESKFTDGMTLDNYGKWHLDHIKPIALATTKEEVIELNHYTNFQPLWAIDNLIKGSKY